MIEQHLEFEKQSMYRPTLQGYKYAPQDKCPSQNFHLKSEDLGSYTWLRRLLTKCQNYQCPQNNVKPSPGSIYYSNTTCK